MTIDKQHVPQTDSVQRIGRSDESGLILSADSQECPEISVVLPTLNEEAGIGECIERIRSALRTLGTSGEIIVSDMSTDDTPDIAREMGARVVEPDRAGYGYAYRYGFQFVRGDYIVMGDADTTYDFEELPELFRLIKEDDADIAMGSRLEGTIESGAMPALHQYVGNPLLTKFLNVFYDAHVSDAHSGFRVLTRYALDELELSSDGMEFASEMIMDASVKDLRIEEVPITYTAREGDATLDSFRDGWRHVKFMLQNAPGYLFTLPTFAFIAAGVATLATSMVGNQVAGLTFGTHTAIAGSLLTIVGFEVGCLAVYSTVATEPIRKPRSPLVEFIVDNFQLEHGATAGLALVALGGGYVLFMVARWIGSGYVRLPFVAWNMVAFTALVLGVQLIFHSFFLSMIVDARDRSRPVYVEERPEDAAA